MMPLTVKRLAFLFFSALSFAAAERPNVILIISDDHAFDDYGFMGSDRVNTPVLDKLADESLTYTRGYVMPVCSPTLASLLTGKLPHEHRITGNDLSDDRSPRGKREALLDQLQSNSLLLPKALTEAGYLTFQTGKLWNGTYEEMGFTHGMTRKGNRHGDEGLRIGRQTMQPIFDFIENAEAADKPFFIWHAPFLPHTPHNPPERLLKKYRGNGPNPAAEKYYAMVEWLDETTGELEDYLVANGLKNKTVVLYLADNGWDPNHDMWNNHRAKLSPYEKGIRTPMMIRWPGKVRPAMDNVTLAHVTDLPKTILEITGAKDPGDLPGLNMMNRDAMQARDTVFVEAYNHDIANLSNPAKSLFTQVVIHGWWKLLIPTVVDPDRSFATKPEGIELYNLKKDPYEKENLADQHPETVQHLKKLQKAHWDPDKSAACCGHL
ncbi:sulfatase [Coraliomargarita sinensis]|uniref:Sulfatase n=1 Tax=Coraliomargarita sinensis TaxID=2174842 RepID=A0A317ZFE1_9BACT|nr:sulfatase-like hydrolase/transferase [Coraliomargarita sinensis]PXA04050.1 sulfatase [Coraliomargarita sinensis]